MKRYGLNGYYLDFFGELNSATCGYSSVFSEFYEKMKAIVKWKIFEQVIPFFYNLRFAKRYTGQNMTRPETGNEYYVPYRFL